MINVEPGPDGRSYGFLIDWDICKWEEDFNLHHDRSQSMGISVCLAFTSFEPCLFFTYVFPLLGHLGIHV